ncbi:Phylloplanin [Apostasia shenzhenica]|uniref:Phylloplanin n=1 Tax=Apostasia shenzhenica TaxID=1088818 RepID=A0A2I0A611_9ASPA|nr:Phylloplanin [Apostasia shenzhenica]
MPRVHADAAVQLQCGGSVMSSATTNSNGVFDMALSLLPSIVSTLLSDCKLVVATPLAACGITLPAGGGTLQSALQLLNPGGLVGQILGLINIIPSGFSLVK